jgi:hypothetical protein
MGCFGVGVDPHHRKTSPCVSSEAAPVGYFRSLLEGILPGTEEPKFMYEQRQQALKSRLKETWARFEIEN